MQSDKPYCSRSYERGREILVASVRDAIAEKGLAMGQVLVPLDSMTVALARFAALIINGQYHRTPILRALTAALGSAPWST